MLAVLALLTVTVGSLTAPLRSLEQAIASGKVTHVEIEGEMQAGGVGHAVVTIVWRADTFSRVTEVMQVRGSADTVGELPHIHGSVSAELSRLAPGALSVEASPAPSSYGESFGWRVPTPMVIAALLWSIALLALLIRGPEPAFATRWAWFWLFSSGLGAVCVVAYLVLVARGVPPDPHRRRLTGGWAFLLSVLLPSPWRP